jgi:hypothetical protein
MSKQVQELVSSLHEHVGDKVVVLCTGYNTKPECNELLIYNSQYENSQN